MITTTTPARQNRRTRLLSCVLPLLSLIVLTAPAARAWCLGTDAPAPRYAGHWEGPIQVAPGKGLLTVLHLTQSEDGAYTGTMDSPEQGAFGIPASKVTIDPESGSITVEVAATQGTFEGRLEDGGKKLVGTWRQSGASLPLAMTRQVIASHFADPELARVLPGTWEGKLEVGAMKIRLVFHVTKSDDGGLEATMDSPDQGATGITVSEIKTAEDGKVRFHVKAIRARYECAPSEDGSKLVGTFHQAGQKFPLELARVDKASTRHRPQMPKPPFPYREEEVTYANEAAGTKLAGTLTLPPAGGPFPAALLITGSGPQDRDETLLGHKPFLVIADHLTRHGIAVLRVDDRGVGGSSSGPEGATSADFAGDVRCGVEFLKERADIKKAAIGLIGHSEGGLIAPMVASESDDVAFIVLLAGPGISGKEILYLQADLIMAANGANEKARKANRRTQEEIFALLESDLQGDALTEKIRAAMKKNPDLPEGEVGETAMTAQVAQVTQPWFRYFITYDPVPALKKVRCPVLALNGELDLQVPPKENLAPIKKALEAGGNTDVTIRELEKLNHLFQHCETGSPGEYAEIEETFAPEALDIMTQWIKKRTG